MNWKLWLKGLAAVAVGGAAAGATGALGNGQLNRNTAITAGIGAITTVIAYLLKSPLSATPDGAQSVAPQGASNPAAPGANG
jgi:hypothetical protein